MAKVSRDGGSSQRGVTRQNETLTLAGTDVRLAGSDSDLIVDGVINAPAIRINGRDLVAPARLETLEHQPGINRWRQKLAVSRSGGSGALSAIILVVGDSRVRSSASKYRLAWIDRLRTRFLGAAPGSYGFLPASEGGFSGVTDGDWPGGDNPWTYAGGVSGSVANGLGFHAATIPSGGGSATITYFGDKVTVFYVKTPGGPTAATVTLDGTSVGPLNARATQAPGQNVQYDGGAYGFHTLVVTPNDGPLVIEGVQWFDGDSPFFVVGSVQMFEAAHAGFGAKDWNTANNDWSAMLTGADGFFGMGLTILDVNDIAAGRTPTQFRDDLLAIVNRVDARLGTTSLSWLFCCLPTSVDTTAHVAAMRDAAKLVGLSRASVFDMAALRPGRAWGTDLSSDGSHGNDAAHIWAPTSSAKSSTPHPRPTTRSPPNASRSMRQPPPTVASHGPPRSPRSPAPPSRTTRPPPPRSANAATGSGSTPAPTRLCCPPSTRPAAASSKS